MKFNLSTQQGLQKAIDRLANLIEYGNLLACTDMASLLNSAADIIEGKLKPKPKTCGTCRFWTRVDGNTNWTGNCDCKGMKESLIPIPAVWKYRTAETFGCIKHEERMKE